MFAGAVGVASPVLRWTRRWNASDLLRTPGNTPSPPLLAGRRNVVMGELAHADRISAASLRCWRSCGFAPRAKRQKLAFPWRVPRSPAASGREQACELWKNFTASSDPHPDDPCAAGLIHPHRSLKSAGFPFQALTFGDILQRRMLSLC